MAYPLDGSPVSQSATTQSITSGTFSASNSGALLVCAAQCGTGGVGNSVSSVTDSSGLVWTRQGRIQWEASNFRELSIWTAQAPANGTYSGTITAQMTTAASYSIRTWIFAFDNVNIANVLDPVSPNPASNKNTSSTQSISVTTSTQFPYDVLVGFVCSNQGLGTITRPSGFINTITGGTAGDVSYLPLLTGKLGSTSLTWSWTGTADQNAVLVLALQLAIDPPIINKNTPFPIEIPAIQQASGFNAAFVAQQPAPPPPADTSWIKTPHINYSDIADIPQKNLWNAVFAPQKAPPVSPSDTSWIKLAKNYYILAEDIPQKNLWNPSYSPQQPAPPVPADISWITIRRTYQELVEIPQKSLWNPVYSDIIGGIAVGTQGTGIYSGYTLVGGDDFNANVSIMGEGGITGRYSTVNSYSALSRLRGSPNNQRYSWDPLHTGYLDANRGVAPASLADIMTQSGSVLSLKIRPLTTAEQNLSNGMAYSFANAWSSPYLTFTAPALVEFRFQLPASSPQGFHPTVWVQQINPLAVGSNTPGGGTPAGLEFDLVESSSQQSQFNVNEHGTVTGWSSGIHSLSNYNDGNWHVASLFMTTSGATLYIDGVSQFTYSGNTNTVTNPYQVIMTNVLDNASFAGDTGIDTTGWNNTGNAGRLLQVDYYRVWLPNAQATRIVKPLIAPSGLGQVAYNAAWNFTLPTGDQIFGAGNYDSVFWQGIKIEDFEPGGDNALTDTPYQTWPAGLSVSSNVLSGTPTGATNKPGRLNIIAVGFRTSSSLNYTYTTFVDVGPRITTTAQSLTYGQSYSHDLYTECDCGNLLPKMITVGALPAGLTFDGISVISGKPTGGGTYVVPVTVINSSGQQITSNVTFTVAAAAIEWQPQKMTQAIDRFIPVIPLNNRAWQPYFSISSIDRLGWLVKREKPLVDVPVIANPTLVNPGYLPFVIPPPPPPPPPVVQPYSAIPIEYPVSGGSIIEL